MSALQICQDPRIRRKQTFLPDAFVPVGSLLEKRKRKISKNENREGKLIRKIAVLLRSELNWKTSSTDEDSQSTIWCNEMNGIFSIVSKTHGPQRLEDGKWMFNRGWNLCSEKLSWNEIDWALRQIDCFVPSDGGAASFIIEDVTMVHRVYRSRSDGWLSHFSVTKGF